MCLFQGTLSEFLEVHGSLFQGTLAEFLKVHGPLFQGTFAELLKVHGLLFQGAPTELFKVHGSSSKEKPCCESSPHLTPAALNELYILGLARVLRPRGVRRSGQGP